MKKLMIFTVLVSTILFMASCGGGDSSGGTTNSSTPVISNLILSPSTVSQGAGGGYVNIYVSFDFSDNGVDLAGGTAWLTISAPNNYVLYPEIPLVGYVFSDGTGTANIITQASTYVVGTVSFVLYVTDVHGNRSNEITGSINVAPYSSPF